MRLGDNVSLPVSCIRSIFKGWKSAIHCFQGSLFGSLNRSRNRSGTGHETDLTEFVKHVTKQVWNRSRTRSYRIRETGHEAGLESMFRDLFRGGGQCFVTCFLVGGPALEASMVRDLFLSSRAVPPGNKNRVFGR